MSVGHYENFPVASLLLPARLRRPVAVIYRFARSADDFADEGNLAPGARLALLDGYRAELDRIDSGHRPQAPLFQELREVVAKHRIPLAPFHDLLDAFSQDVTKERYASFAEVMDYCRRSADPVGRLMLHLYDMCDAANVTSSDSICSALQLVNFWQDVEVDFRKNRIYLPQDEMERFGVTEAQIADRDASGGWWSLMRFQIERARSHDALGRAARVPPARADRPGDRHCRPRRAADPREARGCAGRRVPPPAGARNAWTGRSSCAAHCSPDDAGRILQAQGRA